MLHSQQRLLYLHSFYSCLIRDELEEKCSYSTKHFFFFFLSFLFLHRLHSCRRQNVYAAHTLMCIYIFVFFCFLNYVNCATLTTLKLMMTTMGDIIIECYTYIHTSTYVEAYESERMKEKRRRKCGAIIRRQNE